MQTLRERLENQDPVAIIHRERYGGAAPQLAGEIPHSVRKIDLVRTAAVACAARYHSKRTNKDGIDAFMEDLMHDDPRFFFSQLVKLQPKNVQVDTTTHSFQVIMITDGKPNGKPVDCLPIGAEASESDAESAT